MNFHGKLDDPQVGS